VYTALKAPEVACARVRGQVMFMTGVTKSFWPTFTLGEEEASMSRLLPRLITEVSRRGMVRVIASGTRMMALLVLPDCVRGVREMTRESMGRSPRRSLLVVSRGYFSR
jgi:hypothetical protein